MTPSKVENSTSQNLTKFCSRVQVKHLIQVTRLLDKLGFEYHTLHRGAFLLNFVFISIHKQNNAIFENFLDKLDQNLEDFCYYLRKFEIFSLKVYNTMYLQNCTPKSQPVIKNPQFCEFQLQILAPNCPDIETLWAKISEQFLTSNFPKLTFKLIPNSMGQTVN